MWPPNLAVRLGGTNGAFQPKYLPLEVGWKGGMRRGAMGGKPCLCPFYNVVCVHKNVHGKGSWPISRGGGVPIDGRDSTVFAPPQPPPQT